MNGKSKALVQVSMGELWTHYRSWIVSPTVPPGCDIQIDFGECMQQLDREPVLSPYTLLFNWTPQATGPASFTWPTGIVFTSNNVPIQVWTHTGTDTIVLWQSVTATLAGPTATVTQTIGTNFGASLPGEGTALPFQLCNISWLSWLCGTMFGMANWLLALIFLAAVIFLLWLASRRKASSTV